MSTPRTWWLVLAAVVLLMGLAASEPARASTLQVTVDGQTMSFDQPPLVTDGHVLVPLRGIFERLGADVKYSAASRTITATRAGSTIELTLGGNQALVNGNRVMLEAPAQEVNGRTLVPLRFVSEALGAQVTWNAAQRLVAITSTSLPPSTTINPPPPTASTGLAPTISSVYHNAQQGMQPGTVLRVEADGSPGAFATFDLLGISTGNAMTETARGHYVGTVAITPQMPSGQATTVVVHLTLNGLTVASQSSTGFTIVAAPSATAMIEWVRLRSNAPVQAGQGVEVLARGTASGYATMRVSGRREVPMTEVRPGLYRATYIVEPRDDLGRHVRVEIRLQDGSVARMESSLSLAEAYRGGEETGDRPGPNRTDMFVTVDSPRPGERLRSSDFTVTGTTQPFATVTVHVVVQWPLIPGVVDINQQVVDAQVQADSSGRYAVPVHVRSTSNRATAVVNVTARDSYGRTSQPVEFDIATGQ